MRNLNKIAALMLYMAVVFLFQSGCKKDLLVSTPKPSGTTKLAENNKLAETDKHVHYGREFPSLDSTVRDSAMVITPNGPRLKSDVHLIPEGHKLKFSGTHLQEIEISTGKLINDFGVQAPLKYIKSNLQKSPTGTQTTNNGINPVPAVENWVTWAQTSTVKGGLNSGFSGNWTVPSLPTVTTDGQIIFIWVGLTDVNNNTIVQPIIQFGNNLIGGSNTTWSMTTAFQQCNGCQFYYAPYYPVAKNAQIAGSIHLTGTPGSQTVTSSITDGNNTSYLPPVPPATYQYATLYATLEQYFVTSASDYPPDQYVPFTLPLTQNLVPEINSTPAPLFGEHTDVTVGGAGYAYLYFHPETIPTISYTSPMGYTVNTAITPLTPTVSGGNPTTTYSVSPALPTGLTLNTSTGVISGTPTVVTEPNSNTYTVTATNNAGSGHTNIVIEIWAAPVLTVAYGGHSGYVIFTATPNIPSPVTGNLYWKDLTTGQQGSTANSPYGQQGSYTVGHTYQFYMIEYGTGSPGSATSNTVQYTVI